MEKKLEANELVQAGLAQHKSGQLEAALLFYAKALLIDPGQPDANNLSADIYFQFGNNLKALYYANQAIALNRNDQFLNTRGRIFISMGKLDEALSDLKAAIKLNSNRDVQNNLSVVYRQKKEFKKAADHAKLALAVDPQFLEAWVNLAAIKQDAGDYGAALEALNSALSIDDKNLLALASITKLCYQMGNLTDVLDFGFKAVTNGSQDLEIYFSLAHAFIQLNRFPEAADILLQGFSLINPALYKSLGALLAQDVFFKVLYDCCQYFAKVVGNPQAAMRIYDQSIMYAPDLAHALWVNKGSICFEQHQIDDAMHCNEEAMKCNPNQIWAINNLGVCYLVKQDSKNAIEQFEHALSIDPHFSTSLGWLLKEKSFICDWSNYGELRDKVSALQGTDNTTAIAPFTSLSVYNDPAELLYWARLAANELFNSFTSLAPIKQASSKPLSKKKIRIGYYSFDFRNHPVAHLTARLFEVHDHNEFEIYAYSYGPDDGSAVRERIKANVKEFVDLKDMSVIDTARRIAQDEIDFLIDLTGNTLHTRSQVFALRPARFHAHWLGFVGTMGSNFYDFILADDIVAPPADDEFFAEKVLRLPLGMHVIDDTRVIDSSNQTRARNNLPASGIVFGCFSQTFKIQPEIFSSWMSILLAVPNSVLWLASGPKGAIENLKLSAQKQHVDPDRIIIAERCEMDEYLSRFSQMDLYLDTFPYTSGTVASDALFAGCPLLTLSGKTMVSRMSASIVTHAGLPELIAHNPSEYIEKAIEIAQNPVKRRMYSEGLLQRKVDKNLFNTHKYVKSLENEIKFVCNQSEIELK